MIADLFIKRPKFAIVIAILMVLAGLLCLEKLPVAEYPEIAPTSINVQATYTGASAQVVMETLASPIEEELNGLENLIYFSSKSDNTGGYSLSLTFKSGTDSDINMVNVQNALKRVEYKLPKEVTDQGIKIRKRSSDILGFFAFRSTNMSSLELNNFVKSRVKDEIARVPGISAINLMPEKNYSMRIWLDALRMSALNITPDDVSNAIKAQNVQAAAGSIGSEGENNFIQYKVNVTGPPEDGGGIQQDHRPHGPGRARHPSGRHRQNRTGRGNLLGQQPQQRGGLREHGRIPPGRRQRHGSHDRGEGRPAGAFQALPSRRFL